MIFFLLFYYDIKLKIIIKKYIKYLILQNYYYINMIILYIQFYINS